MLIYLVTVFPYYTMDRIDENSIIRGMLNILWEFPAVRALDIGLRGRGFVVLRVAGKHLPVGSGIWDILQWKVPGGVCARSGGVLLLNPTGKGRR